MRPTREPNDYGTPQPNPIPCKPAGQPACLPTHHTTPHHTTLRLFSPPSLHSPTSPPTTLWQLAELGYQARRKLQHSLPDYPLLSLATSTATDLMSSWSPRFGSRTLRYWEASNTIRSHITLISGDAWFSRRSFRRSSMTSTSPLAS